MPAPKTRPKRKVVLHVGLHKTATTTIQIICARHRRQLEQAGFVYPIVHTTDEVAGRYDDANHSKLLSIAFPPGREPGFATTEARRTLEKLVRAKPSTNMLLVSEECSRFTVDRLRDMREFFDSLGLEMAVVCTVRRPTQWLNSMVGQAVIGLRGRRLTIQRVITEFAQDGGVVLPPIRRLQLVFPDVVVSSFSSVLAHPGGPVGHFLSQAGVNASFSGESRAANESRSDASVRVADAINAALGWRFASPENNRLFTHLPTQVPSLYALSGPKFFLRAAELQPLLGLLREENEALKTEFGPGFHDEEIELRADDTRLSDENMRTLADSLPAMPLPVRNVVEQLLARGAT